MEEEFGYESNRQGGERGDNKNAPDINIIAGRLGAFGGIAGQG